MNDFSEHNHHNNTFVNGRGQEVAAQEQALVPQLEDCVSENSQLESNMDTYQYLMTPTKRMRRL